ncbi:COG0535 Predicted Fe-S oxidoreductases [uncultured Caudovirales phage]|uniref:COG0535 Predicted Fe-S oxidoreductases n=1 Tax=uncultured Caudovirales phage TaxID=2100421 RepID=A0A6J5KVJ9_9CAUD|nr:COG0535 Predicted Fe-S oxidoreductases [uncultured Caudovirales phage]CAB5208798.1 COG0535 Predicted Fe-S oxidoreductases [uncultured Caudovirales phage]
MTFYKNIVEMEIENSSICNAACPACVREQEPGKYDWLSEQYLDTSFFDKIPDTVYANLKKILFTGTVGDPCTAPNFLEVVKLVRSKAPNVFISVSTNGGMKSTDWWERLAEALGSNSEVTFAIDGLEDTNDIYRVNVRWNKIIENVSSFILAGGYARWQFIVFEHNQHQVNEARMLAEKLKFKEFIVRPSHRFKVDEFLNVENRYGRDGIKIKPPTDNQFVHKVMFFKKDEYVKPGSDKWFENSNATKINCFVKESGSIYIDHLGRILPCCFLSGGIFVRRGNHWSDGWDKLWETYGDSKVNLHNHTWDEVISAEFFTQLEASWTKSYADGRIVTCAGTCSEFKGRLNDPEEFCNEQTTYFN